MRAREISPDVKSYDEVFETFRWQVPEIFNIAADVCDRHAANPALAERDALLYEDKAGHTARFTFRALKELSDKLAGVLAAGGLQRGGRAAVLMPQRPETALSHLAIYKLGAIAVPLTVLFRRDALRFRLQDSGAHTLLLEAETLPLVEEILPELPELKSLIVVGEGAEAEGSHPWVDFWAALETATGPAPEPVNTRADDPAMIVYTSGTTGNPKGALHAHRFLIGHLPGFELSHEFTPQQGDCFWTPADWAWVGGLLDVLLAAWHYGIPVVGYKGDGPFDPERALALMEKYGVRNAFLPPTALKMMAQVRDVGSRYNLNLRTLMSGGEPLGAEMLAWARENLAVGINEIYGQTEMNYLVGNCQPLWPARPGSMGRPYPGHRVAVVDGEGQPLAHGNVGEIAVLPADDPVCFLGYWNNPEGTREKFAGDWALTGDLGVQDEEGYFWFRGRKDDVIISAGHRIGPTEVEEALMRHPAVALAAVVASPDALRGHVVKAFIRPAAGFQPSEGLAREIQAFVKANLARHEYPRLVEFLDDFPLTTTGKIRRNVLRQREQNQAGSRT